MATLVPVPKMSSAHDMGIQLAESDIMLAPQPGCSGDHTGEENVLTGITGGVQAVPPQLKACPAYKKCPTSIHSEIGRHQRGASGVCFEQGTEHWASRK